MLDSLTVNCLCVPEIKKKKTHQSWFWVDYLNVNIHIM